MTIQNSRIFPVEVNKTWFELQAGIRSVMANFQKGQPEGNGQIIYTDESTLHGYFVKGQINGKVRLFNSEEKLLGVGLYRQGLPHGPFWIYSYNQNKFAQVYSYVHLKKSGYFFSIFFWIFFPFLLHKKSGIFFGFVF